MKQPPVVRHPSHSAESVDVAHPVVIGRIGQVYGIKGWLKLQSYTLPETNIANYRPWYLARATGYEKVNFTTFKPHGKGFVAHIDGCDDRTLAQQYVGLDIVIAKDQLPELPEDEYYLFDLEGMTVQTVAGATLGTLSYLMQAAGTEIMVIEGEKQHLIPLIKDQFVKSVDKKQHLIIVDWDPEF